MSYRIRNWSEYNAGLKQRGSLTFWLSEDILDEWMNREATGRRGASLTYSDLAIATFETLKSIYGLAGRQTEGLLHSLFDLMGVDLPVPEHSTVSRRKGQLSIALPVIPKAGSVHLVVDSTGIKVYGEGEWKTRQHGVSKRRTWLKLHLGIDEATGEILAGVVTTNNCHDSEVLADLLEVTEADLEQVSADGAYDTRPCYEAIQEREAKAGIPPRKNAKIWQHGNGKAPPHPRDENLRAIRQHGRKTWKRQSNYHRRSLAETTMYRLKTIFGGKVRSRLFDNQATELLLQCVALNRMIQVAKPDTVWIDD
jgi:IS5 family transposase